MSAARLVVVHALIAVIVAGSAWDIVRDREHWPFSQYPMFSRVERDWSHRTLRVFTVASDGHERALLETPALRPFDQCRLSTALMRLRGDAASLDRALASTYRLLEANAPDRADRTSALRVYELRWNLRPGLANDERPDARTVVAEYRPSSSR